MCGGGGGGLDPTTQQLQQYQLEQARKEDERLKQLESDQQKAKNQIRALYGYEPIAYDNMISQDQKNAIYAYYDNKNAKPTFTEQQTYRGDPIFWNGRGEPTAWETIVNKDYAANKATYKQALQHWNAGRDKYYQSELAKLMQGVDMSGQSAEAKANAVARQAGYDKIRASNMALMQDQIGRDRTDATRQLSFGLARSGLSGGSVDIDENRNITDANQRMVVQANQLADGQVAQVKGQDEAKYAQSIQAIDAGLDADTAITSATQNMLNNRDQAINDPTSNSINNLFSGIGNFWSNYQYQQGATNPYGKSNSVGSASGSKGRVS